MTVTPFQKPATTTAQVQLCYYANRTDQTLTLRLEGTADECFERLIFPHERRFFNAAANGILKVYRHGRQGLELVEAIACQQLQVRT